MSEFLFDDNNVVQQAGGQPGQVKNPNVVAVGAIIDDAVMALSEEQRKRQQRIDMLWSLRIRSDTEIPPIAYALSVDGKGVFALADIHAVKAKQKAGKTTALKVIAGALMCKQLMRLSSELDEPHVLWLDTEQQAADVKLILDDIIMMTGVDKSYVDDHLFLFPLRKMNYETLLDDASMLVEKTVPQVVIIDGVVEFVASFNDEFLSRKLVKDLQLLADEHQCAIVCVLHENKAADDDNMRGHLGTVLGQKAGTILQCVKSRKGIISVTCPDARHGAMPQWNICFNEEGYIVDADAQFAADRQKAAAQKLATKQQAKERVEQERLNATLDILAKNGNHMMRNELTALLAERLHLSRPTVSKFLTKVIADGKIFEANKSVTLTSQTTLLFDAR